MHINTMALLATLLEEFRFKIQNSTDVVKRNAYFLEAPGKIKVVIGMRRTGKTYFLFQRIQELLHTGVPIESVLFLNFEDDRLFPFTRDKLVDLIDAFYTMYPENHHKRCYIFLDEIQNVEDWSRVVRRLFDTKLIDIYLSGSSAKLLSKEIATELRGRALATELWPYDFDEYLNAKNINIDKTLFGTSVRDKLMHAFTRYLNHGGFPEVVHYEEEAWQNSLQDYIDIVVFRDIIERHRITHPAIIKYMIIALVQNAGKLFSIHKFYNDLKSQGYRITKDALYQYMEYVEDAYLVFGVPIYSESLRKKQVNPKKYYVIDSGLARAVTFELQKDYGRLFENIIYLDLRRRGWLVHYYMTTSRREVDFLVQNRRGEKHLLQVTWDLEDPNTRLREEAALAEAIEETKLKGHLLTLESYLQKGLPF
jgi:predicted AAA+ superfamily ATPase